jgi:uncharacterized protein with HEPN domain
MKEGKLGDTARLRHILDAVEAIEDYTRGVDFDTFCQNSMMFNASIRQLEIIGEASNHLSGTLLERYADIEWAQIIALRNLLIHAYFGVNPLIVWEIIQYHLPVLKIKIRTIL